MRYQSPALSRLHHSPITRLVLAALSAIIISLPAVMTQPAAAQVPEAAAPASSDFFGLVGRDPWYEFDGKSGQPRLAFQEAMLRNMAAAGAGWVRIEFHTAYETTAFTSAGQMNYAETDIFIDELAPKYGIKVLALINSGVLSDRAPYYHYVYNLTRPDKQGGYISAFADRAREIAGRYAGRIAAYEIFNEPNINAELGAWTDWALQEVPPEVFGTLLVNTYDAIRSVDSTGTIVLGGLLKGCPIERCTPPNLRYTTDYLRAVYNAPSVKDFRTARGRLPFDGVGLHPYPDTSLPRSQWLGDSLGLVGEIGTVMSQAGDPGKLWITEIGVKAGSPIQRDGSVIPVAATSTDEAFQANWLRDFFTTLKATHSARVARAFWFKYEDFPPPAQTETWGLVRLEQSGDGYAPSGAVRRTKPGFAALHNLAYTPVSTWLFAEGYTSSTFDEYLTVQNPGASSAQVVVVYQPSGAAPVIRSQVVAPYSRATINVHELDMGVGRGWSVAARVLANKPIVVERPMYFSYSGWTGGHVALGAPTPSSRWYFAEGFTGAGFDMYLTLQNPTTQATNVSITYLFKEGGKQTQGLLLPAESRQTVAVHDVVGRNKEVSMIVESSGGIGIVAERPMYFHYGDGITGGHVALGARKPATAWYFAEGFTGPGFDQYFTILNANDQPATINVTYFLPGNETVKRSMTVGANKRGTIAVHSATSPGGLGRGYENSALLESDVPVVIERPMYFRYSLRDGRMVDGGHNVVGANTLATTYQFAEGYTGEGFDEYLTIQNSSIEPNRLRLTFQLAGGGTVTRETMVGPNSRQTILVHDPIQGVGPGQSVSVTVTSLDGRPFLAERPMYFSYGAGWTGGHVAIGYAN